MAKIRDPNQQVKQHFPDFPGTSPIFFLLDSLIFRIVSLTFDLGKPGSFDDCVEYFKGRFRSLARDPSKEIYTHVTTAVDKENVRVVSGLVTLWVI